MVKNFEFDSIVVGGGGAGLRTSIQLAGAGQSVAVFQKFFPPDRILLLLKEVLLQR